MSISLFFRWYQLICEKLQNSSYQTKPAKTKKLLPLLPTFIWPLIISKASSTKYLNERGHKNLAMDRQTGSGSIQCVSLQFWIYSNARHRLDESLLWTKAFRVNQCFIWLPVLESPNCMNSIKPSSSLGCFKAEIKAGEKRSLKQQIRPSEPCRPGTWSSFWQ